MPKRNYLQTATKTADLSSDEEQRLTTWTTNGLPERAARVYRELRAKYHDAPGSWPTKQTADDLGMNVSSFTDRRRQLEKHKFLTCRIEGPDNHWALLPVPQPPKSRPPTFRGINGFNVTWRNVEDEGGILAVKCPNAFGESFLALPRASDVGHNAWREAKEAWDTIPSDVALYIAKANATKAVRERATQLYSELFFQSPMDGFVLRGFKDELNMRRDGLLLRESSRQQQQTLTLLEDCSLIKRYPRKGAIAIFPCPSGQSSSYDLNWPERVEELIDNRREELGRLNASEEIIHRWRTLCQMTGVDPIYPNGTWAAVKKVVGEGLSWDDPGADPWAVVDRVKPLLDLYVVGTHLGWFDTVEPRLGAFLDSIPYLETVSEHKRVEIPWGKHYLRDFSGKTEIRWDDPAWWDDTWPELIWDDSARVAGADGDGDL